MFQTIASKTHLVWGDGTVGYIRTQENDGTIYWDCTTSVIEHVLKLQDGNWYRKNRDDEEFVLLSHTPTYEQEYQEGLLAQYPFEKRVREIIATVSEDAENRVNHIMCQIADDVAFEDLVEEYIK
jgi:hypothetical protein